MMMADTAVEDDEKSVLYDLWVLAPEWTDSIENVFSFIILKIKLK